MTKVAQFRYAVESYSKEMCVMTQPFLTPTL